MLRRLRNILTGIALFLLLILYIQCPRTPSIKGENGKKLRGSIAYLDRITLGGVKQSILVRGNSRDNPVLLFLHGGPGMPMMYLGYTFQRRLEERFIVVQWDQRGAGKSYRADIPVETMNVEQFLSDAVELITYLQETFGKDKIYLVGHSWGSYLGMLLVSRHPSLFHAYVGVGQVANGERARELQERFIRMRAKETHTEEAIADIEKNGPASYEKWLFKFGGVLYKHTSWTPLLVTGLLSAEYSLMDAYNVARGSAFSSRHMTYNAIDGELMDVVTAVRVPVFFFLGRHDYVTPSSLSEEYFNRLDAPAKMIVWFDESAHYPFYEEPEKFAEVMIEGVLLRDYVAP